MAFDFMDTGIMGLIPTQGMDVCLHLSVLCCPVQAEALLWADPSSKESYQLLKNSSEISYKEGGQLRFFENSRTTGKKIRFT
jgi:hypothetical protein